MPLPVDINDASPLYADTDAAATGILSPLKNTLARLEQSGVLVKSPDGKYAATIPVSQNDDSFSIRARLHPGWTLAGLYHSHPSDYKDSQVFSGDDIDMARKLGVPSYVLFQKDGQIRSYNPASTQLGFVPIGNGMVKTTAGDPVAASESVARAYPAPDLQAVPDRQSMLAEALRADPDKR